MPAFKAPKQPSTCESNPFQGQELKEEAPTGPLGGDSLEDGPRIGVGVRGAEWR